MLLYIRRWNLLNIFFGSFENMLEMVPIRMSNQGMCVFFHMLKWDMKIFRKGPSLQIKVNQTKIKGGCEMVKKMQN